MRVFLYLTKSARQMQILNNQKNMLVRTQMSVGTWHYTSLKLARLVSEKEQYSN